MRRVNSSTDRPQEKDAEAYPLAADLAKPAGRVAMPRLPRLQAPGGTVHVVGRCNNREFCFTGPEDFHSLMAHLREMARLYAVTLYAYTLMANHVHLLLQAPLADPLARPLRWFFRETTRAWQRAHGGRGHFWERRYWACLVEDDTYALAALRYLDRNPVRAGLVEDPAAYPWSSCAAYALGTPNPLISYHPSYLALSRYPKVRQRHYRALLAPSADPRADARDPRWTTERAVGSAPFLGRHGLEHHVHGETEGPSAQNQ
jgi:putative transposase